MELMSWAELLGIQKRVCIVLMGSFSVGISTRGGCLMDYASSVQRWRAKVQTPSM
jgi:hypothetical protein